MKTTIVSLLALASLILAFAFIATAPAAPNKANLPATPASSALPATPAAAPAERHPEIREALESLRRAKAHMEHAAHDFGGHRVEAIEATNQAIKQLELCLKFDKTKREQTTQRFLKVQKARAELDFGPGHFCWRLIVEQLPELLGPAELHVIATRIEPVASRRG